MTNDQAKATVLELMVTHLTPSTVIDAKRGGVRYRVNRLANALATLILDERAKAFAEGMNEAKKTKSKGPR